VVHDHAAERAQGRDAVAEVTRFLRERAPWIRAVVLKVRAGATARERNGVRIAGDAVDDRVREHGVWYAVDLALNRDCSLYLDTRELRAWALAHLAGARVLNTFAYTASLGVAATAAGAARVLNTDRNARFLALGRASYALNRFEVRRADFQAGDFFPKMRALRSEGRRFDCVFLDPPYYSATAGGVVDLERSTSRLVNKVRPLVDDGGRLVVVNNALFTSGAAFAAELDALCADGYLALEQRVDVPEDFAGYPTTRVPTGVPDPAPFNHATKIAVLRVTRSPGPRAGAAGA
jgi:23S rRNA (cytosine1962-C5)-methyltransferase